MRKILALMVAVFMLSGVVGCGSSPSEYTYTEVSVGSMTMSLPDHWQRPDDYEELIEATFGSYSSEVLQADTYSDDAEDFVIIIELLDMNAYFESEGMSWRGWDTELEEVAMTTGDYAEFIHSGFVEGLTDVGQESHQQLTIGGHESWETTCTGEDEDETVHIGVVVVFTPDALGVVFMVASEVEEAQFEEVWTEVRDSIDI